MTTSTSQDVSLEIRTSARGGKKKPLSSSYTKARATLNATQRLLLVVPPVVLALLLLLGWYVSTTYGHVSNLILPAPADVFAALSDGLTAGWLLSNAWITIQESLLGFLLAVVVALPLGYGLAKSRLIAATVQPYLAAGQAIPAIVIAPILIIWVGYGLVPIVILCMLVVLFPMVITTELGVRSIDPALVDAARVEGASGWAMLARIEFPLALPAILAAVRTGLTLSITGALVGEFVSAGGTGLGGLLLQAQNQINTALLFATLIILAVLAALYYSSSWLLMKLAAMIY
ncbi:MAG TPA: ABC transporter permease [Ktedonobacteraceae bacterium]|nr:ABC transporter permease [Ktedonobacteraceae bacterium]